MQHFGRNGERNANMHKLTIVIPVYNASHHLPKCLDSILQQTSHELEIICVDDASTDNSLEIIYSYMQRDERVKCVKLENNSDDDFSYSESFSLQKEIDGSWYRMPDRLSNYGFNSILIRLPAHESVEQKCDITKFGELGKGHYRIEKEGLLADFYIR